MPTQKYGKMLSARLLYIYKLVLELLASDMKTECM